MLEHAWTVLAAQFETNQFLTGATLTGVLLGVVAWLRSWLMWALAFVKGFFTVSLTVHSEDILYLYISSWLYSHGFDRFSRSYRLRYIDGKSFYGPALGTFRFLHQRRFVQVTISAEQAPNHNSWTRAQTKEFLTISYLSLTRSRSILENIVSAAIVAAREQDDRGTPIYVSAGMGWHEITRVKRRQQPAVVLPAGELERIEADIETFLARENWYLERGVPFRRGYLLTGPPGTGKTSLVRHLAQRFGMPVYISDGSMRSVTGVPPGSIMLLEDVDSITRMRQAAEELVGKGRGGNEEAIAGPSGSSDDMRSLFAPSLSELLNSLDGLASVEKVVVVMTTNHPERLDHAMVRPGRVDVRMHLAECTEEQAGRLFEKFYRPTPAQLRAFLNIVPEESITPAQLQGIFLESPTPEAAIEGMHAFIDALHTKPRRLVAAVR